MNTNVLFLMELPIVISGFLQAHKTLQIYIAREGKFNYKDVMKIYIRKLVRIYPMYFLCFLGGWSFLSYMSDS